MASVPTLAEREALLMMGWTDEAAEPAGDISQYDSCFQNTGSYVPATPANSEYLSVYPSPPRALSLLFRTYNGVEQDEAAQPPDDSIDFINTPQSPTYFSYQQVLEIHQPKAMTSVTSDKIQKLVQTTEQRHAGQAYQQDPGLELALDLPKGKKRGLKPKVSKQDGGKRHAKPQVLSEDSWRRRLVERDRLAAARCRHRKQREVRFLVSQDEALANQNCCLSSDFHKPKKEPYCVRSEGLSRGNCNSVLIQRYIAKEALRAASALPSNSP